MQCDTTVPFNLGVCITEGAHFVQKKRSTPEISAGSLLNYTSSVAYLFILDEESEFVGLVTTPCMAIELNPQLS